MKHRVEAGGIHIAYEKVLLLVVLLSIWLTVLVMEKVMPHQSAAVLVLGLIAVYSFMIFLANLHQRRQMAQGKIAEPEYPDYHPSVSIVIPAHNEALVISETVKNMMAIDYANYELWIFDDRSTDGTADVLESLAKDYPGKFHFVVRPQSAIPGKSAVLNEALEKTDGEVILVFDADARVNPDFLKETLPYLAEPGVGAVQAQKIIMNAKTNLLTRCQHHEYLLDAHFQEGRDSIRGAVELRGNGQLVKRLALQSVDGWTEDTITDDLDLSTKLHLAGWDIRFTTKTQVFEEGILRFKPLLRQRRRWAEGSLKRYLEHGVGVFTSPHVSKRATMDMLAYFIKFLFPLWVTSDCVLQVINLFFGDWPSHLISSVIALPILGVFFVSGAYVAIRHHDKVSILHSFVWAMETAVFLLIVWVPVVMWITAKILVTRDDAPLNWGKTEHLGTQALIHTSRLERLKSLLQRSGSSTIN